MVLLFLGIYKINVLVKTISTKLPKYNTDS